MKLTFKDGRLIPEKYKTHLLIIYYKTHNTTVYHTIYYTKEYIKFIINMGLTFNKWDKSNGKRL